MTLDSILQAALAAIATLFVVGFAAIVPYVAARGWFHRQAREYVRRAADRTREGKYTDARSLLLIAIRLNTALRENTDVSSLAAIIESRSGQRNAVEIDRVRAASEHWAKSGWEVFLENRYFQAVVVSLLALVVLYRIGSFF